jgi:peptidoglycan/LPS O-acetylase OafA/YrhL
MMRSRFSRLVPLGIVTLLIAVALVIAPRDPGRLDPNIAWASPSSAHLLGAGEAGVDLLAVISWARCEACF